jgi:trehalose synthase
VNEVGIVPLKIDRFDAILSKARARAFAAELERARRALGGRTLWHVNSTSTGGGVAEMLQTALCYLAGAGIDARWLVTGGDADFFVLTKRIHHMLHDRPGDGGPLDDAERELYVDSLRGEVPQVLERVRPGDVAFLHDPQTLGLAPPLREAGAGVVWTCHVGVDRPGEEARAAWRFLLPHARSCHVLVFTRPEYVWEGVDPDAVEIVPPCIDAFSPKNQPLEEGVVRAILSRTGIVPDGTRADPAFTRRDGSDGLVASRARTFEDEPVPAGAQVVTQVSRWDALKDHRGAMTAFARHVPEDADAHLVLAGPSPAGVDDDPEGAAVLDELVRAREELPGAPRRRVHIACLPMDDVDENAATVNALQRRSAVVVQKSLAEGFGLTVAEAMWKARPVAATRVGGIQDQIEHGRTGVLVDDPADLRALGAAVTGLLENEAAAERMGRAAHESVAERYLVPQWLVAQLRLAVRTVKASSS